MQEDQMPILTKVEIVQKTPLNHDCYIYKLKFIDKPFHLKIGQHFRIIQTIKTQEHPQGQQIVRKYTPISPCSQKQTMDVLFKIYRPNVNPKFPAGGKLTPWIQSLNVGDVMTIQGPYGRFGYEKKGIVVIDGQKIPAKRIFFIAGGSGITPCYQTIKQIAAMADENIQMILLFANKQEQDIVLRKQLQELGQRLKIFYIVDKGHQNWKGYTGYITQQILKQICKLDDPQTIYVHCGPGPMNQLIRDLFSKNYPTSRIFKF